MVSRHVLLVQPVLAAGRPLHRMLEGLQQSPHACPFILGPCRMLWGLGERWENPRGVWVGWRQGSHGEDGCCSARKGQEREARVRGTLAGAPQGWTTPEAVLAEPSWGAGGMGAEGWVSVTWGSS